MTPRLPRKEGVRTYELGSRDPRSELSVLGFLVGEAGWWVVIFDSRARVDLPVPPGHFVLGGEVMGFLQDLELARSPTIPWNRDTQPPMVGETVARY